MVTELKSPHNHLSTQQQNNHNSSKYQITKNIYSTNLVHQYSSLYCNDSSQIYIEHKFFENWKTWLIDKKLYSNLVSLIDQKRHSNLILDEILFAVCKYEFEWRFAGRNLFDQQSKWLTSCICQNKPSGIV